MELKSVSVSREEVPGPGPGGIFRLGDTCSVLPELAETYREKVKCVYLDPPFRTGKSFSVRVKVGAGDWRKMAGSLELPAYEDRAGLEEYLAMMRGVLSACREMLCPEGALFLHVDRRMGAYLRLLGDELFGEKNLVNELIWAYRSGGRTTTGFSRKHDVILFYRKSDRLDFDVTRVMEPRSTPPENHMRRHVDPDGRVYRSIRSGGKTYTYYDDDPVAPTDVWDDISILQQRDYERTGYETQKPLRLLKRIERSVTQQGELVMDLFAGSGTSLEAARLDGFSFFGMERNPVTVSLLRRRLEGSAVRYELSPSSVEGAHLCAEAVGGIGLWHVRLGEYYRDTDLFGYNGEDLVDNWSVGYLSDGVFREAAFFARSHSRPELLKEMRVPVYGNNPVIRIGEIGGDSRYFLLDI